MKEQTIGEWIAEQHDTATLRNNAHWTLCRSRTGTYASVRMRVLVVTKGGLVLAKAELGEVCRGADAPHDFRWQPDSQAVKAANEMLFAAERTDYSDLPVRAFDGMNRAMPWEVVQPKRGLLTRLFALFR